MAASSRRNPVGACRQKRNQTKDFGKRGKKSITIRYDSNIQIHLVPRPLEDVLITAIAEYMSRIKFMSTSCEIVLM